MSTDMSVGTRFLSDIGSLLDTHVYGLPKWISRRKQQKLLRLSNDVYSVYESSKDLKQTNAFLKVVKILLSNLERKIYSPNAAYYLIKTFHFLHIYIKHLPRLAVQLITEGKVLFFTKLVSQLNVFLAQFTCDSKVNPFLFLDKFGESSKYSPLSDCGIIACIICEYLKLCNTIIKELLYCKLGSDVSFAQSDNKIYTKFVNAFARVAHLKFLISSYNLSEFYHDKEHPQTKVVYKNEMYCKCVIKITSTTLFPPPPAYELRIMLLEFLDCAIKLAGWDSTLKNKCVCIIKTPVCKVNNGQIKMCNKDAIQTRVNLNFKSNLTQLIILVISLIDADALTINCNSLRYFYGQYYLSLPSTISEQDGTVSTLSLGSRLSIDPKLAALVVYRIQSIALDILSQLGQIPIHFISNKLCDRLINLTWYYAVSFTKQINFPESNIEFNSCCGGADDGLKCTYIDRYDIVSSMKLIAQSLDDLTINNPHATKPNLIHLDLIATKIDNKCASLQDRVEFSVDKGYWIINNNICNNYISPHIHVKSGTEITYTNQHVATCKCNIFCLYNKHIYNDISWICSNRISMPCKHRKKLIVKALEIILQSKRNGGKNTQLFSGFNITRQITNRSRHLLKSLISTHNGLDVNVDSTPDDQALIIYSKALAQVL